MTLRMHHDSKGGSRFGASRIRALLTCPRSTLHGPRSPTLPMIMGSLIHRRVAQHWYERLTPGKRAQHVGWDDLSTDLEEISADSVLRAQSAHWFENWLIRSRDERWTPLWVEREIEILDGPFAGATTKPDLIAMVGKNKIAAIDLKTTSAPLVFKIPAFDLQAAIMTVALREWFKDGFVGVFHDRLSIGRAPARSVEKVDVTETHIDIARRVFAVAKKRAKSVEGKAPRDCAPLGLAIDGCRGCAGWIECTSEEEVTE